MKYCKDCKYCSYQEPSAFMKLFPFLISTFDWLEYSKCLHDSAKVKALTSRDDLVTGIKPKLNLNDYSYCGTMRSLDYNKWCGEEGKFWEPKE